MDKIIELSRDPGDGMYRSEVSREGVLRIVEDMDTAELRTKLLYAEDAAAKGEAARLAAAGMETDISELRAERKELFDAIRTAELHAGIDTSDEGGNLLRMVESFFTRGKEIWEKKVETLTKERNEAQNSDAQATNELELVIIQRDHALDKEHKAICMLGEWSKDAELEKLRAEVARLTRENEQMRETQ